MSSKKNKSLVLFPDVQDEAYQISWYPEVELEYPFVYRFYIRNVETGELITPSNLKDFWAEYPAATSPEYLWENRKLSTDILLSVNINIKSLLARAGVDSGFFLLSAHWYSTEEEILAEREQSVYLQIFKDGLKPPTLP